MKSVAVFLVSYEEQEQEALLQAETMLSVDRSSRRKSKL